jgi:prepilin-type processing-associated H-X9-DG protein
MLFPRIGSRPKSARIICVNNQKRVGTAFRVFAADNGEKFSLQATNHPYLYQPDHTGTAPGATSTTIASAWQVYQAMWKELQFPTELLCPSDRGRATFIKTGEYTHNYSPVTDFNGVAGASGLNTTASLGHPRNQNRAVSYAPQALADELNPLAVLIVDRNINFSNATNAMTTAAWLSGSRFTIGDEIAANTVHWVMGSGLMIHDLQGNLTFADGSVQMTTATTLQAALHTAGQSYGWGTPASPEPGATVFLLP